MNRPAENSWRATESKLLPSMVCGMAFLHRDENAAACGTEFSSGGQRSFNSRAIIRDLDNFRGQKYGIVRRCWAQHFDRIFRGDCARRMLIACAFHQVIGCSPITMAIEQRANDAAVQDSVKSLVFFLRFPLGDYFAVFRKTANMQAVWICRAAAEANVSRRIFFLKRLRLLHWRGCLNLVGTPRCGVRTAQRAVPTSRRSRIRPQRRSDVKGARADQPIVIVLLGHVGAPPSYAGRRE